MHKILSGAAALTALFATSAIAADMAVKAPTYKSPPPVTVYSWTGCYLGVEGGYGSGRSQHIARGFINGVVNPGTAGLPITPSYKVRGGLAGGEAGCNYQFGNWVVGIEGDDSWSGKRGSAFDIPPFTVTARSSTNERWFATARGRLGYAFDRGFIIPWPTLFYVTGGAAFAGLDIGVDTVTERHSTNGWTVGWGSEYAIGGNWSFKTESLYARFDDTASHQFVPGTNYRDVSLKQWVWRAGLNYHFGGGGAPIHAAY